MIDNIADKYPSILSEEKAKLLRNQERLLELYLLRIAENYQTILEVKENYQTLTIDQRRVLLGGIGQVHQELEGLVQEIGVEIVSQSPPNSNIASTLYRLSQLLYTDIEDRKISYTEAIHKVTEYLRKEFMRKAMRQAKGDKNKAAKVIRVGRATLFRHIK